MVDILYIRGDWSKYRTADSDLTNNKERLILNYRKDADKQISRRKNHGSTAQFNSNEFQQNVGGYDRSSGKVNRETFIRL